MVAIIHLFLDKNIQKMPKTILRSLNAFLNHTHLLCTYLHASEIGHFLSSNRIRENIRLMKISVLLMNTAFNYAHFIKCQRIDTTGKYKKQLILKIKSVRRYYESLELGIEIQSCTQIQIILTSITCDRGFWALRNFLVKMTILNQCD